MRVAGLKRAMIAAALCAGLSGCRHKPVVTQIPLPPPQQLPVDTTAEVAHQPVVAPVPVPSVPLTSVTVPTKKVKKPKKSVATTQTPAVTSPANAPPVQMASVMPQPEADVIGALTPGGSDMEQQHRDAEELIASLERRLGALSSEVKKRQKEQLMRVKNFQREAQIALNAGDAEGAVTLATKAKLLLDDLVK